MHVAIVAHTARAAQAARLQRQVGGVVFLDDGHLGAWGNHRRALEHAAQQNDHTIILEDDAQPVDDFHHLAALWATRFQNHLVSLYLGTNHPRQWMAKVDEQWDNDLDYVSLPKLIHAVAYTLSPDTATGILQHLHPGHADYAIGDAATAGTGLPVIYPKASLVQHADEEPVETMPRGQRQPRRARQLA